MLSLKHRRNFPRLPRGFPVSPLPHSLLRWKACGKSRETQQAALTKNHFSLFFLRSLRTTKGQSSINRSREKKSAESFVNRSRAGSLFAWKEDIQNPHATCDQSWQFWLLSSQTLPVRVNKDLERSLTRTTNIYGEVYVLRSTCLISQSVALAVAKLCSNRTMSVF